LQFPSRGSNECSLLLDKHFGLIYLNNMRVKEVLALEISQTAGSMIQGSLTELTRKCGDPSCACATDPARRHGPHLYLLFKAEGKTHSVYVLPEQGDAIKEAHRAWVRFQEIGMEIAADNRARFLLVLQRAKQKAKAQRARSRAKAGK
jgi:hypothetical protein